MDDTKTLNVCYIVTLLCLPLLRQSVVLLLQLCLRITFIDLAVRKRDHPWAYANVTTQQHI